MGPSWRSDHRTPWISCGPGAWPSCPLGSPGSPRVLRGPLQSPRVPRVPWGPPNFDSSIHSFISNPPNLLRAGSLLNTLRITRLQLHRKSSGTQLHERVFASEQKRASNRIVLFFPEWASAQGSRCVGGPSGLRPTQGQTQRGRLNLSRKIVFLALEGPKLRILVKI